MLPPPTTSRLIRFGPFQVDLKSKEIRKRGLRLKLQEQPFKVLVMLLEVPGEVVTREELRRRLWPESTFVEFEQSINKDINKIRAALGDSPDDPSYIETLPKRGYRFIAPADRLDSLTAPSNGTGNETQGQAHGNHPPDPSYPAYGSKRRMLWAAAVGGLILAGVFAALWLRDLGARPKPSSAFERMKFTRLTTSGNVVVAAISPDGKYLAHASREAGKQSLWLRQIATSSQVRVVPPAECEYWGLTFARDGDSIYYVRFENDSPRGVLYVVSTLGGNSRKLIAGVDSPVAVSPDGKRLAYVRRNLGRGEHTLAPGRGEDALMVVSADGSGERTLATRRLPDFFSIDGPAWSPDGKVVATAAGTYAGGLSRTVVGVPAGGGPEKRLSSYNWWYVGQVEWPAAGGGLIVPASQSASLGNFQLWRIPGARGEARRITNDLNDYDDVSVAADGSALVTVQYQESSKLWIAPLRDASAAKQITFNASCHDGIYGMSWTADGRVVYTSNASGDLNLWVTDSSGSNPKQLTSGSHIDAWPSVCANSRYVVFASFRAGSPNIWRIGLDGSNPLQLTHGESDLAPGCSPDSQWVVYQSSQSGVQRLYKVPIEGGKPVPLSEKSSYGPAISPDGKWIACVYQDNPSGPFRIATIPMEGGEPGKSFDIPATAKLHAGEAGLRWTHDGTALSYVDEPGRVANIWIQPLAGGPPKPLTDFSSQRIFHFAWSVNGKQLALARGTTFTDAVLISNFK